MTEVVVRGLLSLLCGFLGLFVLLPVGLIALSWVVYALVMAVMTWMEK